MAVHGSLRMDAFDHAELVIIASTIGLSILLSILSFSSYRKTKLKKMVNATAAFALFAIFAIYLYLEENMFEGNVHETIDNPVTDITLPIIPLVILLLFFSALIKKDRNSLLQE
jgi:tellurite resistance protein TehA-like permease